MKKGIHPQYYENAVIICTCGSGNKFIVGSTKKEIHVEICSACHPFYTGQKTQIVDTGGRIKKFREKYGLKEE